MNKRYIAAQLYTLRDYTKNSADIEKTFKRLREIGYEAVQVSGMGYIEPERLKNIADETGITICVTHTPDERLRNDTLNVIKEHKLWGCEYVGIGGMPLKYRESKEGFITFAKEYSELGKKFAEVGLKFVYHNHKFEFEKFDGITGLDILFNESDPETFGFEIDTYWVQAGGGNPVEWIKKVEGRMGVIHLKDMAIKNDEQVYAEIGEGNLNWTQIIQACHETGVKWYAVEQDICLRDPFDSMAMSFKYLQNWFKQK